MHELRIDKDFLVEEAQALKISSGDQFGGGGRARARGSFRGRGRGRGRPFLDRSTMECFNCQKLGHFQWKCQRKKSNYAEVQDDMLLMAYVEGDSTIKRDTWFLDSWCSNHICGKKDYFVDFDGNYKDNVKLGNGSSLAVIGKGNVRLQMNGIVQIITGVYYVSKLKNNLLLSVGQLQEKRSSFLFQRE